MNVYDCIQTITMKSELSAPINWQALTRVNLIYLSYLLLHVSPHSSFAYVRAAKYPRDFPLARKATNESSTSSALGMI